MKKFLTLLMALSMCLSLAACGGSSEETAETPDSGETAGEEGAVSSGVEDGVLTIAMECATIPTVPFPLRTPRSMPTAMT